MRADPFDPESIINDDDSIDVKRFRKPLRILLVLIALSLLVFAGINSLASPRDRTDAAYKNVVIEEGDSNKDAAKKLQKSGIIKKAKDFELLLKLTPSGKIRPGTYFLSPSMNSFSIIQTLTKGMTTSTGFNIHPGLTVEQIATAFERDSIADKDAFIKAASDKNLLQFELVAEDSDGLKGTELVEGFLLPGDYSLSADADESMILIMILDSFSNYYNEDYRARADELSLSTRDVLIIASMLEMETSLNKERAAISSVIHNRINLELTEKGEIPKVPLCSPSKESIEAALYPEETEYTHYVLSDKLDGTHIFTADDEEYKQLLEKYKEAAEAKRIADEEEAKKAEEEEAAEEAESEEKQDVDS